MPHISFDTGAVSGEFNGNARNVIPGVEPGGSRVGHPTKPALLIKDCYAEIVDYANGDATGDWERSRVFLKLSQETDLTPGLILPVAAVAAGKSGTANIWNAFQVTQEFKAQGSVWAPRVVGVFISDVGGAGLPDTIRWFIHLDYEQVDIPWMDWFILWDFLDGIGDNERQY